MSFAGSMRLGMGSSRPAIMPRMKFAFAAVAVMALLIGGMSFAAEAPSATQSPEFQRLYARLESATYVTEGAKQPKNVIYVFFDPNCPYCRHSWLALQYYEKVGLQVRWLPVAVLKSSSLGRAAAILEADDPAAALKKNESEYRMSGAEGGMPPVDQPKPESVTKLGANRELMRLFGFRGIPAMVWRGTNGEILGKAGMPNMRDLPLITGLPEQWIDDPELDAYR